jgi:hypothetical protein
MFSAASRKEHGTNGINGYFPKALPLIPCSPRIIAALGLAVLIHGHCLAQQNAGGGRMEAAKFTWGAENDFNSRYVWHGITNSEEPVLQPSLWVSKSGLTMMVWGNVALGDEPQQRRLNEVDLIFSYQREWKHMRIEPGVLFYFDRPLLRVDDPPSGMASIKLSVPLGPLRAFTNQEMDFVSYRGAYFGDVGLSFERELGKATRLTSTINLGWGSAKFNEVFIGPRKWAVNVTGFEISFACALPRGLYLRPHLEFSRVIDRQLRGQLASPTRVNIGVAVGLAR